MRRTVGLIVAGLALVGVYALVVSARRDQHHRPPPRARRLARTGRPAYEPDRARDAWDEVDEASYQSFPASDPPSYTRVKR